VARAIPVAPGALVDPAAPEDQVILVAQEDLGVLQVLGCPAARAALVDLAAPEAQVILVAQEDLAALEALAESYRRLPCRSGLCQNLQARLVSAQMVSLQ
jgi:hypothetical protein